MGMTLSYNITVSEKANSHRCACSVYLSQNHSQLFVCWLVCHIDHGVVGFEHPKPISTPERMSASNAKAQEVIRPLHGNSQLSLGDFRRLPWSLTDGRSELPDLPISRFPQVVDVSGKHGIDGFVLSLLIFEGLGSVHVSPEA